MNYKNTLVEGVAATISPLVPVHSSILAGLSGGVDPVVLLHLLHKLAPRFSWQLSAVHVHHGISPNADAWADFCTALCASLNISLHIERVDIAPLREHGIEAAARKLRQEAFAGQSCDFVAVAHHADDQVETLLLQLLRGAGVRGAGAMQLLSERAGSPALIRPLLHFSRQEILDYAAEHRLQWIEDESNADDSYPRNFLRHRVLPLLGERFPAYRDTLSRSAQHFAEAAKLLDDLAQQDAPEFIPPLPQAGEGLGVRVASSTWKYRGFNPSQLRAKNLLRYFLHLSGTTMPQAAQLDDMLNQLCNAREDAAVCVTFGDWQVRRYQGKVHVLPALGDFDPGLVLSWQGELELDWPAMHDRLIFTHTQGEGVILGKLQSSPVTLRLRSGGESLRPALNASTRTLKNLLQEHLVPPWLRDRLPLVYSGEDLVCVPGVAIAAEYRANGHEPAILVELQGTQTGKA